MGLVKYVRTYRVLITNRLNATTVGPRIGSGDVVTPEYACERISLLKRSSNEVLGRIAQMTVFFVYG